MLTFSFFFFCFLFSFSSFILFIFFFEFEYRIPNSVTDLNFGLYYPLLVLKHSWRYFFQNSSNIKSQNISNKFEEHYRASERFFVLGKKFQSVKFLVWEIRKTLPYLRISFILALVNFHFLTFL